MRKRKTASGEMMFSSAMLMPIGLIMSVLYVIISL